MRTEGETTTTNPINIIQAKVERSLLCIAIGQVTFNLTLTINRRHGGVQVPMRWPKVIAAAVLAGMAYPVFAGTPGWGVERMKADGSWSQMFRHSGVAAARTQVITFCDPAMAQRMQWSPPMSVRVTAESGAPAPEVTVLNCAEVQADPGLVKTLIPDPKRQPPKIKETVNLWD